MDVWKDERIDFAGEDIEDGLYLQCDTASSCNQVIGVCQCMIDRWWHLCSLNMIPRAIRTPMVLVWSGHVA